jgi:hypothetical protein
MEPDGIIVAAGLLCDAFILCNYILFTIFYNFAVKPGLYYPTGTGNMKF